MPLQLIFSTPEASMARRSYRRSRPAAVAGPTSGPGSRPGSTSRPRIWLLASRTCPGLRAGSGADAAGTTITRIRGRIAWAYFPETSLQEPLIASWGIRVDESQVTNLTDTQQVERLQQHYADWLMYEQRYVWPSVEGEGLVSPNLIHEDVVDIRSAPSGRAPAVSVLRCWGPRHCRGGDQGPGEISTSS